MKYILSIVITISVLLLTAGCSTAPKTILKEHGTLDLQYSPQQQNTRVNKTISIVSPFFLDIGVVKKNKKTLSEYELPTFPGVDTRDSVNQYKKQLVNAFNITMFEILSKKGFLTKGPFDTFDDITYSEKKQIYLTIIPKFELILNKRVEESQCNTEICRESGILQLGGSLQLKVIEPLTQQAILNKRINLSDLQIEEKYIYDIVNFNSKTYTSIYKAGWELQTPDVAKNNYDVAVTNVMNKFYKQAFEKIQRYISREELLDQESDVKKLKEIKRY